MQSSPLPQLERLFLTDAGLETDLIFNHGVDVPYFASIMLLRSEKGRAQLRGYFEGFLGLAAQTGAGCLLETASWRASADWADRLGVSEEELDALNTASVELLRDLRERHVSAGTEIIISGCMGPRGDGYEPGRLMSAESAERYHLRQARALAAGGPDLISAITMNNVPEAVGVARAARSVGLPVVISFTVETDGRLPAGDELGAAIEAVDATTDGYPAYYMINCAHPDHFGAAVGSQEPWTGRLGGIRANASRCSHAELDAMTELDIGDAAELAQQYRTLRAKLPQLNVLGGCCGTDLRHVAHIAAVCGAGRVDAHPAVPAAA